MLLLLLQLVFVGTDLCGNVTHDADSPHRRLTCVLPKGSGALLPLIVIQANGGVSAAGASVSYAPCAAGTISAGESACCPNAS